MGRLGGVSIRTPVPQWRCSPPGLAEPNESPEWGVPFRLASGELVEDGAGLVRGHGEDGEVRRMRGRVVGVRKPVVSAGV
eukprot:3591978-Prorocentrum_lima.AAC.1